MTIDEITSYREERAAHEKRNYENYLAMEMEKKEKEAANSVILSLKNRSKTDNPDEDGDDDGGGSLMKKKAGKGNKWVEKTGIGTFLGLKGKLAREQKRQLEEIELKKKESKLNNRGISSKRPGSKDSKNGDKRAVSSSRRSRRVKASREASRGGDGGGGLGSFNDDNSSHSSSGGEGGGRRNKKNKKDGGDVSISSDSGSSDEDAGPPMSVEDEAALKEAREKMERQRKERVAAV
jgi:hypothetical protein